MPANYKDAATQILQAAESAAAVAADSAAATPASGLMADAAASASTARAEVSTAAGRVRTAVDAGNLPEALAQMNLAYEAASRTLKAAIVSLTGRDSSVLDEWKECRVTIDRFDKLLVDLRKVGFGFITAIVSAATFFFTHFPAQPGGIAPAPSTTQITPPAPMPALYQISDQGRALVFGVVIVMIVLLFMIDRTHQVWLFTSRFPSLFIPAQIRLRRAVAPAAFGRNAA
jgi:hypothetical protein